MRYADFKIERDDFISCSNFMDLASTQSDIVFIKTDVIYDGQQMESYKGESPHPKCGFLPKERIWITSHSDYPITDSEVRRYSDYFNTWFAINANSSDPRIVPIPLGLNYDSEYYYSLLNKSIQIPRIFQNWAFMSFNVYTNVAERGVVHHYLQSQDFVTYEYPISQESYYSQIRKHPFLICPKGNGYDTHRFWEALYLGAIPVVRENPVINAFKNKLPMLIVKNWSDLSQEYLEIEYERIRTCDTYDDRLLKQSYWNEKIQSKVECEKP